MGLRDALFGRNKVKGFAPEDRLFAITTAAISLETANGIRCDGAAAIVFQRLETGAFAQIVAEMEEVVKSTGEETGTTIESTDDDFGYRWMILRDPDIDDLTVGVNAVSDALQVGGYGERVLCAVFAFRDTDGDRVYFIYNYKRGSWYPFVPGKGAQERRTERELQIKAQLGAELPLEAELERWFPLWGIPI
jgi:hypothetical protein